MDTLDCKFIAWYRSLDGMERIAVRAWLRRGDSRIMEWLLPQDETLRQWLFRAREGEEETQQVMTI